MALCGSCWHHKINSGFDEHERWLLTAVARLGSTQLDSSWMQLSFDVAISRMRTIRSHSANWYDVNAVLTASKWIQHWKRIKMKSTESTVWLKPDFIATSLLSSGIQRAIDGHDNCLTQISTQDTRRMINRCLNPFALPNESISLPNRVNYRLTAELVVGRPHCITNALALNCINTRRPVAAASAKTGDWSKCTAHRPIEPECIVRSYAVDPRENRKREKKTFTKNHHHLWNCTQVANRIDWTVSFSDRSNRRKNVVFSFSEIDLSIECHQLTVHKSIEWCDGFGWCKSICLNWKSDQSLVWLCESFTHLVVENIVLGWSGFGARGSRKDPPPSLAFQMGLNQLGIPSINSTVGTKAKNRSEEEKVLVWPIGRVLRKN